MVPGGERWNCLNWHFGSEPLLIPQHGVLLILRVCEATEIWQDSKGWSELPASTHLFLMFRYSLVTVVTKLHTWSCKVGVRFSGRTKIFRCTTASSPALWPGRTLFDGCRKLSTRAKTIRSVYWPHTHEISNRETKPPTHTHTSNGWYLIKHRVDLSFRLNVDCVSPDWTLKNSAFFPHDVCLFVSCDAENKQYPFSLCKDLSVFSIR